MGTVYTGGSNTGTQTAYGNQRKIDRCQNGLLWSFFARSINVPNGLSMAYSTDNGVTWTETSINNASGSSASNYTLNGSLFIDLDDYAHIVYKDPGNGYIYYTRGTPNAARTAYTWSAAQTLINGSSYDYPDVVAFRDPANAGAYVVWAVYTITGSSPSNKMVAQRVTVAANGTFTVFSANDTAAPLAAANGNPGFPSIDFNHTGDGKTVAGGNPHLYVGWSAGATGAGYGIRFRKATYAAGSWTWGTEREIDNTRYIDNDARWLNCMFDGTRIILVGHLTIGSSQNTIIYERDVADTTTTPRLLLGTTSVSPATADLLISGSSSYDTAGNIYLFGRDNTAASGMQKVNYRRWTRSTTTLEALTTFDTSGSNNPYVSVRRGPQGQAIDYVYTDGTVSPYEVKSGRIVLNQNPTAPTPVSPADNATWDSATDQTVTLGYSDPDNDAASKARVCYRPKGTTVPYAVLEVSTSAASGSPVAIPVPANTWTGDVQWYGQVADASGTWSDPSATRTVTGIPAALAAATGGAGGTSASALDLYNQAQNERALRALSLV